MSEQEEPGIYPIEDPESKNDPIYKDLMSMVAVYNLDHFKDHIINKAVLLLDTKEDLINFAIKSIDDEIDILKEYNQEKKFVVFSEEMIAKVSQGQEFYTIIIQPYLFVQLRNKRDEYIQALTASNSSSSEGEGAEEQSESDGPQEESD